MLRRDRQIRMQIHQLVDACIFAFSFWLAYDLRTDVRVIFHLELSKFDKSFDNYVWLYLLLIPLTPLILESQGFYNRPVLSPRRAYMWPLFKGSVLLGLCVILALFLHREVLEIFPRWVLGWFSGIAFVLVCVKEELVRMVLTSKTARSHYTRRFLLVGAGDEIQRMREEIH